MPRKTENQKNFGRKPINPPKLTPRNPNLPPTPKPRPLPKNLYKRPVKTPPMKNIKGDGPDDWDEAA